MPGEVTKGLRQPHLERQQEESFWLLFYFPVSLLFLFFVLEQGTERSENTREVPSPSHPTPQNPYPHRNKRAGRPRTFREKR